ncbi:hypothetical protein ASG90_13055 [Nocardioides sp. Soil797]|nr:hypothetical protein ASG90_13055 [Nocardioides sp. Soil797]
MRDPIASERMVFVGGLHRSGTTPLAQALASHADISGLSGTGVSENEGQHLQNVYPKVRSLGGMGRFARHRRAHLTERSFLVSPESRAALLESWQPYWDLDKKFLLEKSPANLVMGRFLNALFPGSALVVVIRHPVAVALALEKWNPTIVAKNGRRRVTMVGMMENWVRAHTLLREDAAHLTRLKAVRYEDLVQNPTAELGAIGDFLGLESPPDASTIHSGRSRTYAERWDSLANGSLVQRRTRQRISERFGDAIATFGYDVDSLDEVSPWSGI